MEKVFRDDASGNREPWLVLEREICVSGPGKKEQGVRHDKGDAGEGAKHGLWA